MQRNTDDVTKLLQNYNKSITTVFLMLFFPNFVLYLMFYGYEIGANNRR